MRVCHCWTPQCWLCLKFYSSYLPRREKNSLNARCLCFRQQSFWRSNVAKLDRALFELSGHIQACAKQGPLILNNLEVSVQILLVFCRPVRLSRIPKYRVVSLFPAVGIPWVKETKRLSKCFWKGKGHIYCHPWIGDFLLQLLKYLWNTGRKLNEFHNLHGHDKILEYVKFLHLACKERGRERKRGEINRAGTGKERWRKGKNV